MFLQWLEERCQAVATLEEKAKAAIGRSDAETYRAIMREKAELLADLAQDGSAYAAALPASIADAAQQRLEAFSGSASSALSLNSVFYMSALLFPEDYRDGDPNDLEIFLDQMKKKLA